jgi:hypothetical protein
MADNAAVPATPEVANITQPGAAPASAAVPGLDDAFAQAQATINTPMPSQVIQGTQLAQPHLAAVPQYQPQSTNNRPMTNQATSVKSARQKNNFAAIGNTIGQVVNKYEQRKQDTLKDQIVAVMKAKQQVANANSVLQNPNADQVSKDKANNVLALNTKRIQDLMTEKNAKQMAKAFDISYSDPDKNKNPNVAAGLAAYKEFQAAGPYTADNPQEAAVAKLAQGTSTSAPTATNLNLGAPTAPKAISVSQANPRAAAVLAKDMPSIEANPQYAAALKQKEDTQKQYMTLAPKVIEQSAARINNAAKAAIQAQKDALAVGLEKSKEANAVKIANITDKRDRDVERMRSATAIKVAGMRNDDTGRQMAKDEYDKAAASINDAHKEYDAKAKLLADLNKSEEASGTADPDLRASIQASLVGLKQQITDATAAQNAAQLVMDNNPHATAVQGLLGKMPAITPRKD